jgi:hypothetical protein
MALPLTFLFGQNAQAQIDCAQCGAFSGCDESCMYCSTFEQDGCLEYQETTCGNRGGGCMQSGCSPNYQVVGDELRGTYGEAVGTNTCFHHRVDWITRHDYNQCNTNSAYWNVSSCEDNIDGVKGGTFSFHPDCCDGYNNNGDLDPTYTCNHYHSC